MRCNHTLVLASAGLAALAACTSAAAQSSLAVTGLLDSGVFRGFDGVRQVGTIQRSNVALTGVEDLGGGTQAVFRLSTRVELDTGRNEGAGYKPFWHDESTLGLKGSWGTLRMGRAMTAMWANDWKFDPWYNFNRIASPAWQYWHYLTPSDPFGNNGTAEYGRLDNGVFYDSPALGGVTLRVSGSFERPRAPGAIGRPYSVVLEYGQDGVAAMAAYERNCLGDGDFFIAGKYSFGAAALMLAYDDSRERAVDGRSRSASLAATYRMGPAITLKAGLGYQRLNAENNRFVSFGADYAFSPRTALYFSLGHRRDAGQGGKTAFGVGISHAY